METEKQLKQEQNPIQSIGLSSNIESGSHLNEKQNIPPIFSKFENLEKSQNKEKRLKQTNFRLNSSAARRKQQNLLTQNICQLSQDQLPNTLKTSQKKEKMKNFFKMYRSVNKLDVLLIIFGITFSILTGLGLPFFAVVAGKMVDSFDETGDKFNEETSEARNLFLYIGIGTFFAAWISVVLWMKVGERLSTRLRIDYLNSLMKQEISFIQLMNHQEISSKFQQNILAFKQAVGLKVGTFIFIAASLIAGGRNAISTGWLLSIIMVSTLPLLGLSGVLYTFFLQLKRKKLLKFYQPAEEKSKEVIQNLSTVKSLNGQQYEFKGFLKHLKLIKQKIILYSVLCGIGAGWFSFVQFGVYALAFWFGSHCIEGTSPCKSQDPNQKYTPGQVIVIFFAFYVRLDSMQQILPTLRKIHLGIVSAYTLYEIVDRVPQNDKDQLQKEQSKLLSIPTYDIFFNGKIQFKKVTLFSRKDPEKIILNNISFIIDKKRTGFTGGQVERKAIIDLIMRFYKPDLGQVLIDNVNINKLDIDSLRKKIGFVDNQTGLFDTTIIRNINTQELQNSTEQISTVLNKLQILSKIKIYDQQFDYNIGYQGLKLNEETRKRLMLSKILLKKPRLFLMKQFSLSSGCQSQDQLFSLISQQMPYLKYLIYSGDDSRILIQMDQIIVLNQGKIENTGRFSDIPNIQSNQQILMNRDDELCSSSYQTKSKLSTSGLLRKSTISKFDEHYSQSFQKLQILCQKENQKRYENHLLKMLWEYTKREKLLFTFGFFMSFLAGVLYPVFSIFLADTLLDTFKFKSQPFEDTFIRDEISYPILVIVWIGVASFVINLLQTTIFSVLSEKISERLRIETYQKILYLPMKWFQVSPLNTSFKTQQILKESPYYLSVIPTILFSIIFKNFISAVAGLIIAFIFEWRLALLGFICLPLMMASGLLLMLYFYEIDHHSQDLFKQVSSVISEVILNIRRIHSDNASSLLISIYREKLKIPNNSCWRRSHLIGIRFGLSQLLIFISFTIMFYCGSVFLKHSNSMSVLGLFSAIFAVIWPGWTSGSNFFRIPDIKAAKIAGGNLFNILNAADERDMQYEQESKLFKSGISGKIQLRNVKLIYDKSNLFFENVNFKINKYENLILFGPQGKGIKPLINILLRFQPIQEGQVLIDDINIKDYDINYLRSSFGIINEDPWVFKATLRENIVYNLQASNEDIQKACQKAHLTEMLAGIETFEYTERLSNPNYEIENIEWKGLETQLKGKSNLISISQRQRILIARYLLREPQIYLINDEIKNLSYIFQQKVRSSILLIANSKTCIISPKTEKTIENADKIAILTSNKVYEWSSAKELKSNRLLYEKLKTKYFIN